MEFETLLSLCTELAMVFGILLFRCLFLCNYHCDLRTQPITIPVLSVIRRRQCIQHAPVLLEMKEESSFSFDVHTAYARGMVEIRAFILLGSFQCNQRGHSAFALCSARLKAGIDLQHKNVYTAKNQIYCTRAIQKQI